MAQQSETQNGAAGVSTQNSQKIVEGWWSTAKSTGKIYAEYDKAGVLDNTGIDGQPPFEKLIPIHLDKTDKAKQVWIAPYGITYHLFEGEDSKWDDSQKKYVPTGGKKWLVFRTPTSEYKPFGGGKGKGGWQQYPAKKITEQTTIVQAVSLQAKALKDDSEVEAQCSQLDYLMSSEGGNWLVPQTTEVPFKQVVIDPTTQTLYIVYTLVHKEGNVKAADDKK